MHSYLLLLVEEQKNEESLYFVQKAETFLKSVDWRKAV